MRARLAISASEQVCELREVVLRDKPAAMLAASAKGTVPVLMDVDGRVIDESLDVMLWALHKQDPLHWLEPQEGSLDSMLTLIAACDDGFKFNLDRYKYSLRYDSDAQAHRAQCADFALILNSRLTKTEYLFGARESLADMALAPFIRQFAHTDAAWFDAQPWQRLQAWLIRWERSARFVAIMGKYPKWREGEAVIYFPRTLN